MSNLVIGQSGQPAARHQLQQAGGGQQLALQNEVAQQQQGGGDTVRQSAEVSEKGTKNPRLQSLIQGLTSNFGGDAPSLNESQLKGMGEGQLQKLDHMRKVDKAVKEHEEAHEEVAGSLARGTSYNRVSGPDGNSYRVSGSVQIDTSETDDPQKTIDKMNQVAKAARAPEGRECAVLCPLSDADLSVEAKANAKKAEAEQQLSKRQAGEMVETPAPSGGATGA